ncbi:ATP-binding protein [Lactococcus insecticola]|uniref:Conjugal transfer protein n=1 Tax=Pseudolactococcus insecticola TaxID=2709158 RepID=A0A6A0B8L7_9LACT|nr:ATP-binding protein [Lactococcus insecticola]GFH40808.1 conjugal transfer protein [Lactococcus insecticola]
MALNLEYPIAKVHNNMVLTKEKEVIAYYVIPSTPITLVDEEKKKRQKINVMQVISKLKQNKNFEIALVPQDYLLIEKMRDLSNDLAEDSQEIGLNSLGRTVDYLTNEMEIPYKYVWVIGVKLEKPQLIDDIKAFAIDRVDTVAEKAFNALGYQLEEKEDWQEEYKTSEQDAYQKLQTIRGRRVKDEELFYLQRSQFLRNIPHQKDEVIASRAILNVTDTNIDVESGYLKLTSPYGESYVSILPIANSPVIINANHIAELAQRFNFPVEYRIKAEFQGNDKIKTQAGRNRVRLTNIIQEAHSQGSVQDDNILLRKLSIDDLYKKLGNDESFFDVGHFFIVTASSIEQLNARKQAIMGYFQNMRIELGEGNQDQPYLFQNILYGKSLNPDTRKWVHTFTPKGIAESMLFTTTFSGTKVGHYIGRVDNYAGRWDDINDAIYGSRNLVLYNATIGNKEGVEGKITKNPHIIITGATGQGKSYLAQLLFFSTAMQDVKMLYVDPKREIRSHYMKKINDPVYRKKYPERCAQIEKFNFVTLDARNKDNHGVLDPIVILDELDSIEVAKSILDFLGEDKFTNFEKTVISKAIKEVVADRVAGKKVGFKHVLDKLRTHKDERAREAGEYLYEMSQGTILDLAFSDGTARGLDYSERITILEVADLSLPKDNADKITDHERNSIALMFALGSFCKRFGEQNRDEQTLEWFDEAWILMQSSEGKKVIKSMRRVGRSQNNTLALITQSVNDAKSDDDTTGFGTIFAFYEKSEREMILKHVGLEVDQENLDWIDNMISGQCLMYDVYGNTNIISVHNIFPDLEELFSPMKATVSSLAENKYV